MALFHRAFGRLAERKKFLVAGYAAHEACNSAECGALCGDLKWSTTRWRAYASELEENGSKSLDSSSNILTADNTESLEKAKNLRRILEGGHPPQRHVPREQQKLLNVGVVGAPNAGKSTLTNALTGTKVSAVSEKTNTTFVPTLGAFTEGETQIVLHDTPGIVDSRHYKGPYHLRRVRSAWSTARDCDLLMLIVDAHRQATRSDARLIRLVEEMAAGQGLGETPPPALLLLNKTDKAHSAELCEKIRGLGRKLNDIYRFAATFLVSAKRGDGVQELKQHLLGMAKPGCWLLESDEKTDLPQAAVAAEVVREKIFRRLRSELPYRLSVDVLESREFLDGSLLVKQQILVPTETVRRMVVGKKGCVVGEIGVTARVELEKLLGRTVHLYIAVKVRQRGAAA